MELVYFDITFINKEYIIPEEFYSFILTNDYYDFEEYFNSNIKKYTDEELKRKNHKKFAITFKGSKFYQWLTDVEAEEVFKENVVISPIFMLTANKLMSNKYISIICLLFFVVILIFFCSTERIYFNENICVLLNKKNEKSIYNKRK